MAERTVGHTCLGERRRAAAGFAVAWLVACVVAFGPPAHAQQAPVPTLPPQLWMQGVERPGRGWDYDGQRILGHVGFKVCLWDATTGKLLHEWETHKERIFAIQFSPDGKHALTSSWVSPTPMVDNKSKDTRTVIWSLKGGKEVAVLEDQVAGEFSPDGTRVVTFTARPGKLSAFNATVWETATGREVAKVTLDEYSNPRWDTLHFSPDGRSFAHVKSGAFGLYNSSEAVLYDAKDGDEIGRTGRKDGGHRFTSTGTLASFGEKTAVLTDAKTGKEITSVPHGVKAVWGAAWTHDGGRVAALDAEKPLTILDLGTGMTISGDKLGPYPLHSAVVSPDNNRLAVEWGGANCVEPGMGLYDMGTGKELARVKLAEWGHMIGFAPDGKTLLVGGSEFVVYDAASGKKVRTLTLIDDAIFKHDWYR